MDLGDWFKSFLANMTTPKPSGETPMAIPFQERYTRAPGVITSEPMGKDVLGSYYPRRSPSLDVQRQMYFGPPRDPQTLLGLGQLAKEWGSYSPGSMAVTLEGVRRGTTIPHEAGHYLFDKANLPSGAVASLAAQGQGQGAQWTGDPGSAATEMLGYGIGNPAADDYVNSVADAMVKAGREDLAHTLLKLHAGAKAKRPL